MKDPLEMYTDAGILASLSEMANRARIHEPYVEVPSQLVTSIGMRFEKMMRELERLQSESAWIPVSERLPELNTRMSLFDKNTGFFVYGELREWRVGRYLWKTDVGDYSFDNITHWKFPAPPDSEVE